MKCLKVSIREALPTEHAAIRAVHLAAFGGPVEADLVRRLEADPTAQPTLSLVAVGKRGIVGHAFFSIARLEILGGPGLVILAPLAVLPAVQRRGVGTSLIEHGLLFLASAGAPAVLVLGDPAYYRRLGFRPAIPEGLLPPHPLTMPEAWQVMRFSEEPLSTQPARVRVGRMLSDPALWRED